MSNDNYRELSMKEAFATIGLHPKDDAVFFLANLIIEVKEATLRITKVAGRISSEPEDSYETSEPFIFTHNSTDYVLRAENGKLNVYEKEELIGGRQSDYQR